MATTKRYLKDRRWGRLREIDKRVHVGTRLWYNKYPTRLKHLTAWRFMHKLGKGHPSVRMYGTRMKVRPSSNLNLRGKTASKLAYVAKKKG